MIIKGAFPERDAQRVFDLMAGLTTRMVTYRVTIGQERIMMYAKIDARRIAFSLIDEGRLGCALNLGEFKFNMGLQNRQMSFYRFNQMPMGLLHKLATQNLLMRVLYDTLDDFTIPRLHSIGGRDIAEARLREYCDEMVIQDPSSTLSEALQEKLKIRIINEPYKWEEEFQDDTIYIFLFVIMSQVIGVGSVSRAVQMDRIGHIIDGISATSGSSAYMNFYTTDLLAALSEDWAMMANTAAGFMEGHGYRLNVLTEEMTLGSYDVTGTVELDSVLRLCEAADVTASYLRPEFYDIVKVFIDQGVTCDIHTGRLIDALCAHLGILIVEAKLD